MKWRIKSGNDPAQCWLWQGPVSRNGYGRHGKKLAHRCVYELFVGRIPPTKELDHLCRNRLCVNPDHLEVVTHKINTLRGVGACANNARKTHCKNGHAFNKNNTYINNSGHRTCRLCDKNRKRKQRQS